MTRSLTDAELITRILNGDPLAERALYDRHIETVYRAAFRLSGDSDVAADYTQEAFIKAFASLRQFRGESAFGTWMRAITASVVLTGERKRSRFSGTVDMDAIADKKPLAAEMLFEVNDRVARALDRMSEKLRSVFLMYDVEGFTHAEIAAALDIPEGTSKARLSEARARLRAALSGYGKEQAS